MADFVLGVWQELQDFNPSGGYSVEIPWNIGLDRELTPAEVTAILRQEEEEEEEDESADLLFRVTGPVISRNHTSIDSFTPCRLQLTRAAR